MADIERVKALLDEGHRAFAELGIDEGKYKVPVLAAFDPQRQRQFHVCGGECQRPDDRRVAVSFAADKITSAASRANGSPTTGASPQQYAELHWVVVDKPVRRRGVGSFIVDSACRIAREGGRVSVRADIYPENEPMRWLLETRGFKFCGTIRCAMRSGGKSRVPRMSCA